MTIKIEQMLNIHVDNLTDTTAAAGFETAEARYHVWFNWRTFEITSVLYKNPLRVAAKTTDPDYFNTRQLDPEKKANAAAIAHLFAEIKRNDLLLKARQEIRLKTWQQRQAAAEQRRADKIRDHAEQLLDLAILGYLAIAVGHAHDELAGDMLTGIVHAGGLRRLQELKAQRELAAAGAA